jgi:hypothetical protein
MSQHDENWVLWVCPDPDCDEVVHDPGRSMPMQCENYKVHTLGDYPELVRTPVVPVDPDIEALQLNRRTMDEHPCQCETDERYYSRDGSLRCSLCDRVAA